jgi:hypothetical protein
MTMFSNFMLKRKRCDYAIRAETLHTCMIPSTYIAKILTETILQHNGKEQFAHDITASPDSSLEE